MKYTVFTQLARLLLKNHKARMFWLSKGDIKTYDAFVNKALGIVEAVEALGYDKEEFMKFYRKKDF